MATRKVAYTTLLKEALSDNIAEFDTTKTIDATGPMTKQILSYKGDGELKTTSDAASILERYYFKDTDSGVEQIEEGQLGNELDTVPSDNINTTKKDMEKDIVEAEDVEDPEDKKEDEEDLTEAEEAVIERLIKEMEDDSEDEEDDKEEIKEAKKAKKAIKEEDEDATDDKEDLDVDDEMGDSEEDVNEANLGPLKHPNDAESYDKLEEAFRIFREEIEADESEEEEKEEEEDETED